jgi:glucokinase
VRVPLVLGIDFGGTKVALAVAGLDGERLIEQTVTTEPARGARWNIDRALAVARALVSEAGSTEQLAAVGACTFGIPLEEEVQLAVAIPGWGELALRREISDALGCDLVAVATDVKAAAAAEAKWGALAGADPAIYVNLGTGLAVAIVVGGKVVNGANGAAGEIGYNLRSLADIAREPSERVLLEQAVSGMGLRDAASRTSGSEMSAADVFSRAHESAEFAMTLESFLAELGFHLANLCVALNPQRVAVGGGMVRSWSLIEPALRGVLTSSVPYPPELVLGAFPYEAPLVGAISMAIEAALQGESDGERRADMRATADRGP